VSFILDADLAKAATLAGIPVFSRSTNFIETA